MTSGFPTLGQLSPSTSQVLKRPMQSGQAKWMLVAYYYYRCRSGLQMGQWKPWSLSSGTRPRPGGRLPFVFVISPKRDITKSLLSPPLSSLLPGALLEKSQNSQREEDGEGEIYFPVSAEISLFSCLCWILVLCSVPGGQSFFSLIPYSSNKGTKPAMCSKLSLKFSRSLQKSYIPAWHSK